jgi:hypothetical protein
VASLYLPGVGNVEPAVYRAHAAAHEYDERLSFRRNEATGDYCVFIKTPRPHGEHNPPEIPVLGFGREVPTGEQVVARLRAADTLRRGEDILRDIDRNNDRLDAERKYRGDQAIGDAAERLEKVMRKEGLSPVVKSLRPKVRG